MGPGCKLLSQKRLKRFPRGEAVIGIAWGDFYD